MAAEYTRRANNSPYQAADDSHTVDHNTHSSKVNYAVNGCTDCARGSLCRKHDIRATKNLATPGGISISPELFEKMFLAPQDTAESSRAFGNPSPIGLLGTMLALTPLACDLMGWRGASGEMAGVGAYLFFGGLLLIITGVLEWIIGQTFNCIVWMTYGAFWLTVFATLEPGLGAVSGSSSQQVFATNFGFFLLFMALINLIFLICSLKTDIVHVIIFLTLLISFGLLTGEYFNSAMGNMDLAAELTVAAGVSLFITSMACWYSFLAAMLEIMEFPFRIPTGDLSNMFQDPRKKDHHMV